MVCGPVAFRPQFGPLAPCKLLEFFYPLGILISSLGRFDFLSGRPVVFGFFTSLAFACSVCAHLRLFRTFRPITVQFTACICHRSFPNRRMCASVLDVSELLPYTRNWQTESFTNSQCFKCCDGKTGSLMHGHANCFEHEKVDTEQ